MRVALILFLVTAGNPGAQAAERTRMAVLSLKVDIDLPQGLVNTLNEVLLDEFHQTGQYSVLGASDIRAILSHEAQKRLLTECSDDSCLAELGGAMGVPLLAAGRLGMLGERYVLYLKILDVKNATVLRRASEAAPWDEAQLLNAVRRAVSTLLTEEALEATRKRVDPRKVSVVLPRVIAGYESRATVYRTLAWTFTCGAAIHAAVSIPTFVWNQGRLDEYNNDNSSHSSDSINNVDTFVLSVAISGGVFLGLAVFFWLTGDPPGQTAESTSAVTLDPGPGDLGLSATFRF
jgi:hypothetical protein